MTYVEYKQLNPFQRFVFNFKKFFKNLPRSVGRFFKTIGLAIAHFFLGIGKGFKNYGVTFVKGDWATKLSYVVFGFGDIHKGKYYKGILYMLVEAFYVVFMVVFGFEQLYWLPSLGTHPRVVEYDDFGFEKVVDEGQRSMLILLYGTLTVVVTIVVFAIYINNIKDAYKHQKMRENGERPTPLREDIKDFLDGKYHITLLSFPILMIAVFNILPLIFMILIAFTNYHGVYHAVLFDWNGLTNFGNVFDVVNSDQKATTFFSIAGWTLIWAFAATFTNYILGMIVALMINKKGIKLKSVFRTMFVITIAVPQFVSLLLMSQMLTQEGAFNIFLGLFTGENPRIDFLGASAWGARATVIIVNCWVGIPYTILSMSGILMNIPEDLYESARIDGASPFKTFTKITLPYMIFVTTPQLITQFVGNINNFNVIFLLTGGKPANVDLYGAGDTDILVTWLYQLSMGEKKDYGLASAIGILVFIICATLSLIIYNNSKSMKDEEAFS